MVSNGFTFTVYVEWIYYNLVMRMATEFGKVEKYAWEQYIKCLKFYFEANNVSSDRKQRVILLIVCGRAMYRLICDLFAPVTPGSKSFQEIADKVKEPS